MAPAFNSLQHHETAVTELGLIDLGVGIKKAEGNAIVGYAIREFAGFGVSVEKNDGGLARMPIVVGSDHAGTGVATAPCVIGRMIIPPDIPPRIVVRLKLAVIINFH